MVGASLALGGIEMRPGGDMSDEVYAALLLLFLILAVSITIFIIAWKGMV